MTSTLVFILCLTIIVGSVQTRSIEFDPDVDVLKRNDRPERHSQLWLYLKNRQGNKAADSLDSTEDVKPIPKRSEIIYSDRNSNGRNRPSYTYGRKSHWDTFFG